MQISIVILLLAFLLVPNPDVLDKASSLAIAQDDPWSVPASWNVAEREVRFESDGVTLAGTLYSPEGIEDGPAVVVVQQANTATREFPLLAQKVEVFTAIGYSVLLYDLRGQGESEGDPARPDYTLMAEDAVAGKRAIAEMDEVHPEQIGFWGVSQSGWLAMEAGTISDPAFVISVVAPLTTPGEQMEFSTYNAVLAAGYGEDAAREALEVRRAVSMEYFRGEISYESAQALLADVEEESWFELTYLPSSDQLPEDVEGSSWIQEMSNDPVPAFQGVEVPLLYILGGEDTVAPTNRSLEIVSDLDGRDNREIVVIPGANHFMRIEDPYTESEDTYTSNSVKYFMVMGEWLGRLGLR